MNNTPSIPLLMTLSLSRQSAEILLVLIQEGSQTITSLSKKLSLSRTSVYVYIEELQREKLCAKKKDSQKYETISPEILRVRLEESLIVAKDNFDQILLTAELQDESPRITFSQETNAISLVYKDLALSLPKGATYYRYTSRKKDFNRDPFYSEQRVRKDFERLVITNLEKAEKKQKDPNRFIKTVPKDFPFDDDVSLVIYGDKIAHLDHTTGTAVTITSKSIAHFQEKIFKLLWKKL